ncbi:MAG: caspase family protein [Candidatus Omnitrophica bacterium]|nr:caspase family protein [Candidatus Omnitrophota bacterium]
MSKGGVIKYFLIFIFSLLIINVIVSYSWAKTGAISLGTSKFKGASDLPACEGDARDIADVLYEQGVIDERIEPLTGPNRKKIIEYKIKREAKALDEGDTLIIFNSSHGSKVNGIVTWDGYISDQELLRLISESKCSRVLLINDSCYSGNFKLNLPDKEVCQINSSSAPMVSFVSQAKISGSWDPGNSVFAKYVVMAMRPGNSDQNGDGNVTAGEILDYIKKRILNDEAAIWRKLEDPDYPTLEKAKNAMDKAEEDWEKARRIGDKATMSTLVDEYWKARRAYERKVLRVKMRWQSPTIIGDPDFIVVGRMSWKVCMEEKIKENKFSCEVVTTVIPDKATGQHILEEIYCQNQPFELKHGKINSFMRSYSSELGAGYLPYKERGIRLEKMYSRKRKEEFELADIKSIEEKAKFAQSCGDCKIVRKNNYSYGGDLDYDIVCRDKRTGKYDDVVEAYNCGSRWGRVRFERLNSEVEAVIVENRKIGAFLQLFKTLKACGYNEGYWSD